MQDKSFLVNVSRRQRNVEVRSCTVYIPPSYYYSTPASSFASTPRAHPLLSRSRRFIHSHTYNLPSGWQETIPGHWTSFDSLPYLPAGCGATLGAFVLPPIRTPSTLRDHCRPPASPSIVHQISIIHLRSVLRTLACQE